MSVCLRMCVSVYASACVCVRERECVRLHLRVCVYVQVIVQIFQLLSPFFLSKEDFKDVLVLYRLISPYFKWESSRERTIEAGFTKLSEPGTVFTIKCKLV